MIPDLTKIDLSKVGEGQVAFHLVKIGEICEDKSSSKLDKIPDLHFTKISAEPSAHNVPTDITKLVT